MQERPDLDIPRQLLPPGTKVQIAVTRPGWKTAETIVGIVQPYECYSPSQRTFPVRFNGGYGLLSLHDVTVVQDIPDNVKDIDAARERRTAPVESADEPLRQVR